MKGRRPKDNEQHVADGTFNSTRHGKRVELPSLKKDPTPPKHFDALRKEKWKWLCARLNEMGQMTAADTEAMRLFCEAAATSQEEYIEMMKEGSVIDGRKNPRRLVYEKAVDTMRMMFDQFGLTPLARLRLKTTDKPAEAKDPLDFLDN